MERKEPPHWLRALYAYLLVVSAACGILVAHTFLQVDNDTIRTTGVAVGGVLAAGNLAMLFALRVRSGKVRGGSESGRTDDQRGGA